MAKPNHQAKRKEDRMTTKHEAPTLPITSAGDELDAAEGLMGLLSSRDFVKEHPL